MGVMLAGGAGKFAEMDDETMMISFKTPQFTVEHFAEQVKKLLNDPSFTMNARRLKAISNLTGGAALAVETI